MKIEGFLNVESYQDNKLQIRILWKGITNEVDRTTRSLGENSDTMMQP